MKSEENTRASATASAEGRRFAYVGMARARDTIIMAVPASGPRKGAWIDTFSGSHLLPAGNEHPVPGGESIPSALVDLATADFAVPVPTPFNPTWFLKRSPSVLRLRERLSPSEAEPFEGATVGHIVDLGPRIAVHSDDMGKIGAALHAAIAAEVRQSGSRRRGQVRGYPYQNLGR